MVKYIIEESTMTALGDTIRTKGGKTNKMTPSQMIDEIMSWEVVVKEAFAVFSADDGSLDFYKRTDVPKAGEQFDGRTATEVYTGIEKDTYTSTSQVPWYSNRRSITNSRVVDTIKPVSTACWFYNCTNLTSLDLSSFDTSSVRNMSGTFSNCSKLTTLDVTSFDTSSVTDMSYMFQYCTSLTTLDLSSFDTSSVKYMFSMFRDCSSLTTLDLSSFDTSAVTNMTNMFSNCSSLTTLDLTSFDTSSVTDMSYMLYNCSSLTTLDLSSFDTSSVRNMSSMFYNCSKLQQVKLGEKFAWKGAGCYLPAPNANKIPGADGKWYAMSDKAGYAPKDIPSNKADTYVASPDLLPKEALYDSYNLADM